MTTVPVQEQWGSYNSEDITRGTGGAGNGNGSDNVTSRDAAEEEQNIGGGTGLGLEEGEVVMEELVAVPFCCLGDFNEILHMEEQKGATRLSASTEDFRAWINDMKLIDLALNDRKCLISMEWTDVYSDMRLKEGPRGLSDHCPLIIEDSRNFDGLRPFHSLNSWFTYDGFLRKVKEEWRGLGEVHFLEKMKALTTPLRKWHKKYFGDITEKIKRFEEEIKKVDDMVSSGRYDGTMEARRRALVRCCEKWYVRQDVHWKQMSRSQHASEMNRNTRYFHNIASARRRNNRIEALEDSPNVSFRDELVNRLGREEAEILEVLPSVDEVKETVWNCESSKALGSDGYNMNFIKKYWHRGSESLLAHNRPKR
ncbi:uncharacterized protein [Arachis hypogaea]|uniref:uncharacterized protein n=1 Tax=Arachis hypogaea TaxID=3818 RepID=UPI000DECBA6C|nr:uncharacterized protein LOC112761774 [Arachis hypogaea]